MHHQLLISESFPQLTMPLSLICPNVLKYKSSSYFSITSLGFANQISHNKLLIPLIPTLSTKMNHYQLQEK